MYYFWMYHLKYIQPHTELNVIDIVTLTVKAHSAAEERDKITARMRTGKITKLNINPYMYTGQSCTLWI